jgi:phosphoribosyl-AMP cyclohydrolase
MPMLNNMEAIELLGWNDQDLMPAIVQDSTTREVLMMAFMNAESLRRTLDSGEVVLWSRSRQELWHKGATSGNVLELVEIRVNCEQNSLLYRVRLKGEGACHTLDADGRARLGCYYRRLVGDRLESV